MILVLGLAKRISTLYFTLVAKVPTFKDPILASANSCNVKVAFLEVIAISGGALRITPLVSGGGGTSISAR